MHQYGYFYIMTNVHNTVLYCGATVDLYKRILEHRNKLFVKSFTSRYNIEKLIYFETFTLAADAFEREKKMKGSSRKRKMDLVNKINPEWKDLFESLKENAIEDLLRIKNHNK
jgi:putative endonuclease